MVRERAKSSECMLMLSDNKFMNPHSRDGDIDKFNIASTIFTLSYSLAILVENQVFFLRLNGVTQHI